MGMSEWRNNQINFPFADEITEDWGNGRTSSEYYQSQKYGY